MESKGEKERYTHLKAEFQRIARRDKKAFLSNQCKEIEENNRMGKTGDLFKKMRDIKGTFHAKMGMIDTWQVYRFGVILINLCAHICLTERTYTKIKKNHYHRKLGRQAWGVQHPPLCEDAILVFQFMRHHYHSYNIFLHQLVMCTGYAYT